MKAHKFTGVLLMLILGVTSSMAQKYKSEASTITFYSEAPIENIDALNKDGSSVFDEANNNIVFSIPIRSFVFDKSLMQEHFNEKYMESDKYPKALFTGTLQGYDASATGLQKVTAKGQITIHGETNDVEIPGEIVKNGNSIIATSTFVVKLEDYKVDIPQILWQNIAEQVEVKLKFTYKPL